jgi:serine acetyltransferase
VVSLCVITNSPGNFPGAFRAKREPKYDRGTISQWAGDSQWRACRADLTRYRLQGYTGWGSEGFWALAIYRLQKVVRRYRPRWLWAPARLTLRVVKKLLSIVTLIDLHPDAEIGPGMIICHGGPIRIHAETNIGADCALHGACTIGAGPRPGGAVIGDHVFIGCHASIIGAVTIGDDATIAAKFISYQRRPSRLHCNRCPGEDPARNISVQFEPRMRTFSGTGGARVSGIRTALPSPNPRPKPC